MTHRSDIKPTAEPTPPNPSRVDRLRDELFPNGALEGEMAVALDCSERQVQRLLLPFWKLGTKQIYNVPGSREVLRRRHSINAAEGDPPSF